MIPERSFGYLSCQDKHKDRHASDNIGALVDANIISG